MIEYGHEVQKAKAPSRTCSSAAGRLERPSPGRGPGDAGVGRVAVPVLREGRPGLLHHGPSAGPVQGPAQQAGLAHTRRARRASRTSTSEFRVAGIIAAVKHLKTKKDERMATFLLEDMTGRIEVVAFPEPSASRRLPPGGQLVWSRASSWARAKAAGSA